MGRRMIAVEFVLVVVGVLVAVVLIEAMALWLGHRDRYEPPRDERPHACTEIRSEGSSMRVLPCDETENP
jgi:hypothetical protein